MDPSQTGTDEDPETIIADVFIIFSEKPVPEDHKLLQHTHDVSILGFIAGCLIWLLLVCRLWSKTVYQSNGSQRRTSRRFSKIVRLCHRFIFWSLSPIYQLDFCGKEDAGINAVLLKVEMRTLYGSRKAFETEIQQNCLQQKVALSSITIIIMPWDYSNIANCFYCQAIDRNT